MTLIIKFQEKQYTSLEKAVNNNHMKQNVPVGFIFLISCFIYSTNVAQTANKALDKKIVVTGKQISIDSLLRIFSRQTTIEFSFNSKKISPSKKVVVPKQSLTIFQWLQNLRREVNVDYKLVGNHLVLLDSPAKIKTGKTAIAYAGTNTVKRNKVLPGNKIHNSKVQNNYSAAHHGKIIQTALKNNVKREEPGKKDADTSAIQPIPQARDTGSIRANISDKKMVINDTTQTQVVKKTDDPSPVTLSSFDSNLSWDYKHQLTLTPGIPILESGKYYQFSIGLDYDRKLLYFGHTVKNDAEWERFNLNLELGVDYVFDKDSTRLGGFLIGHVFPDLQYKLGQYSHIDVGAGPAVIFYSPGTYFGYGVNLSINFPVTKQKVITGAGNGFNKIIFLGAGIEMYEFSPDDPLFFGTIRLTMLFPGKKR